MANLVQLENTRFIYSTNFDGNPDVDKYHSDVRRGNVVIPDEQTALQMIEEGFNIKQTKPREDDGDDFVPTYYVSVNLNFDSNWPPKVCLVVEGSDPVKLDEESIKIIDDLQNDRAVENVNIICNVYANVDRGTKTLYVKTMYVEQGFGNDPFAARYKKGSCGHNCGNCTCHDAETDSCEEEAIPFN